MTEKLQQTKTCDHFGTKHLRRRNDKGHAFRRLCAASADEQQTHFLDTQKHTPRFLRGVRFH